MSCCGKNRAQIARPREASQSNAPRSAERPAVVRNELATVILEYRGRGALVVAGPVTGRRYVFAMTGARVTLDARDREIARTFVNLRVVSDR